MSDDTSSSGEGAGGPRRRRPPVPTIELTATEIGDKAAAPDSPPDDRAEQTDGASAREDRPSWLNGIPWRSIAGGAAGGLIVLLLAGCLWVVFGRGTDRDLAEHLAERLTRAEAQVLDLSGRPAPAPTDRKALDELAARLEKLEQAFAAPRPGGDPALGNRLAGVEASAKASAAGLADLDRRAGETAAALREMRQRLDAEAKSVSDLSRQASSQAPDRAELDALARRVAALETAGKSLQQALGKAAEPDRDVRLAVLALALRSAVDAGRPYAAELAAVRPFLADAKPLDALQVFAAGGLPAVPALARNLSALAPGMLAAVHVTKGDAGFLDRLQSNAERLVRIRPVSEAPGDDPAAVIARMEARTAKGDIAGALAELAKLPPAARAPAEAWSKAAAARLAAAEAATRLAADAFAVLGRDAAQGGRK